MKFSTRLLLVLIILVYFNDSYSQGFLKASGQKIVNEKNENVLLRGMGLGGWMLQEGYMFNLGFLGQQYKIKEKITELIGKKEADIFLSGRNSRA